MTMNFNWRQVLLGVGIALVILTMSCGLMTAAVGQSIPVRGVDWDEELWEGIVIQDDSTVVCRLLPNSRIECVPLPAGSVVLVPKPAAFD